MGEGGFGKDRLGFEKKDDSDGKGDGIYKNKRKPNRDSSKAIFKPSCIHRGLCFSLLFQFFQRLVDLFLCDLNITDLVDVFLSLCQYPFYKGF